MDTSTEEHKKSRWATPVLLAIFGIYMFMWGIPAIGHRILLADDYYGMGNNPYFDVNKANCDASDFKKTKGKFLLIYPYEVTIHRSCSWSKKHNSATNKSVLIKVIRPHNMLRELSLQDVSAHASAREIIYFKNEEGIY